MTDARDVEKAIHPQYLEDGVDGFQDLFDQWLNLNFDRIAAGGLGNLQELYYLSAQFFLGSPLPRT